MKMIRFIASKAIILFLLLVLCVYIGYMCMSVRVYALASLCVRVRTHARKGVEGDARTTASTRNHTHTHTHTHTQGYAAVCYADGDSV